MSKFISTVEAADNFAVFELESSLLLESVFEPVEEFSATEVGKKVWENIKDIIKRVKELGNRLMDMISNLAGDIGDKISDLKDRLTDDRKKLDPNKKLYEFEVIFHGGTASVNAVRKMVNTAFDAIKKAQDAIDRVGTASGSHNDNADSDFLKELVDNARTYVEKARDINFDKKKIGVSYNDILMRLNNYKNDLDWIKHTAEKCSKESSELEKIISSGNRDNYSSITVSLQQVAGLYLSLEFAAKTCTDNITSDINTLTHFKDITPKTYKV